MSRRRPRQHPHSSEPAQPRRSGSDPTRSHLERLQKVLAAAGVGSRRECESYITDGRVDVDGQIVTELGTRVDPSVQKIRVDGQQLHVARRVYYALNKPVGVVCTNRDPEGRTRVIDLFGGDERLFTVGRLDRSSEGLLLVTNDGDFANRLAHPRYGVLKVYRVRVAGVPTRESLDQLRRGVYLAEGVVRVEGLRVIKSYKQSTDLEIVLSEGLNREIRRMLARIEHKVMSLKRIAIGPIRLAELPTGAYRKLTADELEQLSEKALKKQLAKAKAARATSAPDSPSSSPAEPRVPDAKTRPSGSSGGKKAGRPDMKPSRRGESPTEFADELTGEAAAYSIPEELIQGMLAGDESAWSLGSDQDEELAAGDDAELIAAGWPQRNWEDADDSDTDDMDEEAFDDEELEAGEFADDDAEIAESGPGWSPPAGRPARAERPETRGGRPVLRGGGERPASPSRGKRPEVARGARRVKPGSKPGSKPSSKLGSKPGSKPGKRPARFSEAARFAELGGASRGEFVTGPDAAQAESTGRNTGRAKRSRGPGRGLRPAGGGQRSLPGSTPRPAGSSAGSSAGRPAGRPSGRPFGKAGKRPPTQAGPPSQAGFGSRSGRPPFSQQVDEETGFPPVRGKVKRVRPRLPSAGGRPELPVAGSGPVARPAPQGRVLGGDAPPALPPLTKKKKGPPGTRQSTARPGSGRPGGAGQKMARPGKGRPGASRPGTAPPGATAKPGRTKSGRPAGGLPPAGRPSVKKTGRPAARKKRR